MCAAGSAIRGSCAPHWCARLTDFEHTCAGMGSEKGRWIEKILHTRCNALPRKKPVNLTTYKRLPELDHTCEPRVARSLSIARFREYFFNLQKKSFQRSISLEAVIEFLEFEMHRK